MSVTKREDNDRREVHQILDAAQGKVLERYETTRAFGYPSDEAGDITLHFEGGLTIHLEPTGYEADGIEVSAKN